MNVVKILVTSADGQLGYDVCKLLESRQIEHIGKEPKISIVKFFIGGAAFCIEINFLS